MNPRLRFALPGGRAAPSGCCWGFRGRPGRGCPSGGAPGAPGLGPVPCLPRPPPSPLVWGGWFVSRLSGRAGWLLARLLPPRRWCGRVFGSFLFRGLGGGRSRLRCLWVCARPLFEYFLPAGVPFLGWCLAPGVALPLLFLPSSGRTWTGCGLLCRGALVGGGAAVGAAVGWGLVRWPRRGRGFRSARLRWASRQRGVLLPSLWGCPARCRLSHRRRAALRPRPRRGLFACVCGMAFFLYTECEPQFAKKRGAQPATKARSKPFPCRGLFSRSKAGKTAQGSLPPALGWFRALPASLLIP